MQLGEGEILKITVKFLCNLPILTFFVGKLLFCCCIWSMDGDNGIEINIVVAVMNSGKNRLGVV